MTAYSRPRATQRLVICPNREADRLAVVISLGLFSCLSSPTYARTKADVLAEIVEPPPGWSAADNILYAFTPNDPYFNSGTPLGFPGQWHLDTQTSGAAHDANLAGAWNRNLTGQGVTIGFVDDGLQISHPDLSPNYSAADSYDFGQNDANPSPVFSNSSAGNPNGDNHGTAVAGVAGARGGNDMGGTGAAPHANLAGLRVDFPNQTTQMFIDATLYHSSGANTDIKVKNHSYGVFTTYVDQTSHATAVVTSHNAGTIHVFAAGNERCSDAQFGACGLRFNAPIDGDANKKHLQSLQETITVAALGSSGVFATYSNWGANIWVTAPSSSFRAGEFAITTTDRTGGAVATGGYNNSPAGDIDAFPDLDYTSRFGGTSSSAPLVAGIMALGKQAQPNLNTRFAKHLLAMTSDIVDPFDADPRGGWITNGAGYEFNQNYGFGLIDADEFTLKATQFSAVTPLVTQTIGTTVVGQTIPDNNLTGISRNFVLNGLLPLEEVEVRLNITHPWRGDLEAFLQSPTGTVSRLMFRNLDDSFDNISSWNFVSNAFWGETPIGQWTLTVRDVFSQDIGMWNNYSVLAKMGSLIPVPEPATWLMSLVGALAATGLRRRKYPD
jgi:subtilisin family serine protease